ncbi:MAG: gliding motility-associated C-terminal domain-containing protein, partial [Gemmatimonadaceae bacterium]|nr:gliding motility-associated C-terminal domain-containing protein [Chitinophagaceae bacterium]
SDDTCGFTTGSVRGLSVSGGANMQYEWFNAAGVIVGNKLLLDKQKSGEYFMEATDAGGCKVNSGQFTIKDVVRTLPAPVYNEQTIARSTAASLILRNPSNLPLIYELYETQQAVQALMSNKNGLFTIPSVGQNSIYYIKAVAGNCTSNWGQAIVKVSDETIVEIPNAFSPNGDGVNDEFRIKVTGLIFVKSFRVYNRYVQMIFESRAINNHFNGTINGRPLLVGTYYYTLDAFGAFNKKILRQGSITLLK